MSLRALVKAVNSALGLIESEDVVGGADILLAAKIHVRGV